MNGADLLDQMASLLQRIDPTLTETEVTVAVLSVVSELALKEVVDLEVLVPDAVKRARIERAMDYLREEGSNV